MIRLPDGTWEVDEFCASILHLRTMTGPFEASKNLVEVITIVHASMCPPESLGFTIHDDNVVIAPRSGIPLRIHPHAERSEPEQVPAAEDAEMPVAERGP